MKKFGKNIMRLIWYIPYRILRLCWCGKVLNFPIGWDTLFPLAPYSEGGLLRKDFLELYKKKSVTAEEYCEKENGPYNEETQKYQFWGRKYENQSYLKKWWI